MNSLINHTADITTWPHGNR